MRFPERLRSFTRGSHLRSAALAAVGFVIAGGVGLLSGVILLQSKPIVWGVSLANEEQPLQQLLLAILLFVLGMGLSGAILGAIGGWVLTLVDPLAPRRRIVWAGAIAFAVPQAILVPIILLLSALLGVYYNNIDAQPAHLPILFGVFGLFYGMMAGALFGFLSVGFKYGWGVLFVCMIGGLFGGAMVGWLLRTALNGFRAGETASQGWLLLLILCSFYGLMGLLLGLVYAWFYRARLNGGGLPHSLGRFWRIMGIFAVGLTLLNLLGAFGQLYVFATMRPATTSTALAAESIGVAWSAPSPAPLSGRLDAVAAFGETLGLVSVDDSRLMFTEAELQAPNEWLRSQSIVVAQTISDSPRARIAVDNQGRWHITWRDESPDHGKPAIFYARCENGVCTEPTNLSARSSACAECASASDNPTIAVDAADRIMIAWETDAGPIAYVTWPANSALPGSPQCLSLANGASPKLAAEGEEGFVLAYHPDAAAEVITFARYRDGAWSSLREGVEGGRVGLLRDERGVVHAAWCASNGLNYWALDRDEIEPIGPPGCTDNAAVDPVLIQDGYGRIHIIWRANEIANNFGLIRQASALYDRVQLPDRWSRAALVSWPDKLPSAVHGLQGVSRANDLYLFISDESTSVYQSVQPYYACPDSTGSIYGDAILNVLTSAQYRPPGARIPFCGNEFVALAYLPDPVIPAREKPTPYGAFDAVAEEIRNARFEVLFATMEWMKDENRDSPGFVFAQAVTDLYEQVKAHPERYPRGMTVRVLLGNYPELATFTFGEQVWNVMDVLQKAGLPEMENPELGWKVELANFDGQNPHSHAKFLVIDGREVMAAGFNYSYLHLSKDHPSGLGVSLVDFGMLLRGPVAQDAVAAYDDLWSGSTKVLCPGLNPPERDWARYCSEGEAVADHVPEALLHHPTQGNDVAFSLLRTYNRPESDRALEALIRSAQETIDVFEVNFSLKAYCALGILMEDFCSMKDSLAYMQALVDVMEQNGVHIRVLVTDVNMNGIENSVAIRALQKELARRGLSDQAEFRYYVGRMHPKAFLVDDAFLVVGSQNFHYSAWGDGQGLVEYNLATNDEAAIAEFQRTFEYFWENGVPANQAGSPRVEE